MKHSKIIFLCTLAFISLFLIIPDFSFAQQSDSLKDTAETLTLLAKVMSWLRIPLANLAGKMMTNSLITGEAFKITSFLFQAWSICRVIANFLIVGVVLQMIYTIAISGKGAAPSELGGKIVRLVVTSLLVNSSWFLLSAVIDLSNVAVLGVSNVGLQIIKSSPVLQGSIARQMACKPNKIKYDRANKTDINTIPDCISTGASADYTEQITPTREDMSGPFMYFGMGVFKTYEYLDVNTTNSAGSNNGTYDAGSITISFLLKIFLMVMFYTPLVAILIVNFVRMLLVRLWFATGPLIALKLGGLDKDVDRLRNLLSFGNFKPLLGGGYSGEDHFDAKNIIGAIFTPVVVVGTLFFAIITIASIFSGLSNGPGSTGSVNFGQISGSAQSLQDKVTNGFDISVDGHTIQAGGSSFQLEGNFIKDTSQYIGGAIGYLIICIMTVGLMRAVFRIGLSTSKLLSKLGNAIMDRGKSVINQAIKLPIGVDGKMVSLEAIDKEVFNLDKVGGYFKDNYIDPIKSSNLQKLQNQVRTSKLGKALGYEKTYTGSINFDTKGTKFTKELFEKEKSIGSKAKLEQFSFYSEDYFRKIRKDINDVQKAGGVVKSDNNYFNRAMSNWLTNGGAEYLDFKKVISKDDYYTKDAEGVEQMDIDKLFTSGKNLGGFVDWVFKPATQDGFKATGTGNTTFDDAVTKIADGGKIKDGKEYAKIEIKPQ